MIKKYILLPVTLIFIVTGAAMPYLISGIQDSKIIGYQKEVQLNHSSLAGRSDDDVEPALRLISKEHNEDHWDGKTTLTKSDVNDSLKNVIEKLHRYNLLQTESYGAAEDMEWDLEPCILMDINSDETVLAWVCAWYFDGTVITIDDATGKAIRIITDNVSVYENSGENDAFYKLDQWIAFLQDYYDVEILSSEETEVYDDGTSGQFDLRFSEKDGLAYYDLCLRLTSDFTFFNY